MQHIPVLIVGGSLVGLSASLFLSWRGVSNIVIEKHEGSALHPRAMGFTERTMEYFTAVGLGEQIPQVVPGTRLRRAVVESLAGHWIRETVWTPDGDAPTQGDVVTPHTGAAIPQDKLEPNSTSGHQGCRAIDSFGAVAPQGGKSRRCGPDIQDGDTWQQQPKTGSGCTHLA